MSVSYINPALPSMIRGLYRADLREKSIQNMLDLAADLVQELIDLRAEQGTEEPEWEYSWVGTDDEGDDWVMDDTFDTRESAEAYTRRPIGGWVRRDHGELVRRRKAGPWVPVEQGDDQTTNHENRRKS